MAPEGGRSRGCGDPAIQSHVAARVAESMCQVEGAGHSTYGASAAVTETVMVCSVAEPLVMEVGAWK